MKRKKQGNKFKACTTKARGGKSFMPQEGDLNRANMYSDAYVAIWPPHTDCGASATTGPMFKPHADCNPDPSWSITGQNVSAVLSDALKDESGTYDNVRIKDALQLIRDNKGEEAIKRLCRKDDRSLELKAAKEEILGAIKEEGIANRNLTEKALKRTSRRQRAKAASPNKERLMGPRKRYRGEDEVDEDCSTVRSRSRNSGQCGEDACGFLLDDGCIHLGIHLFHFFAHLAEFEHAP